ncbi:6,7-dimethyl-8-ribityllumazine synthase [Temperatibacter marinus]|uniref:6,7-dimethyl-8-ribityllumazine synthase n=1 Tax=Temperatibacter marinus TaxID=1456591 RepID=A0AA52EEL5_9PROT|nr:6,7-dimethyl-8-ribityllumazine synthase [Temperatibacter marinus]WND02233.1 6,7-dimethyl-8-ribityllumazine synthase [Temperatibacter marinus]
MSLNHYLIVEARFYDDLADEMVQGAIEAIEANNATYERLSVPGALEIPAAMKFADVGTAKVYAGYIALGVVIRGETSHYDYVCGESARALQELAITHNMAVGNGILTVEDHEQAWARADRKRKNKGADAANAALRMAALKSEFKV